MPFHLHLRKNVNLVVSKLSNFTTQFILLEDKKEIIKTTDFLYFLDSNCVGLSLDS